MRRAPDDFSANTNCKVIINPRKIKFFESPHWAHFFEGYHSINENGKLVLGYDNNPVTAEKIILNHYCVRSKEEFITRKIPVGRPDMLGNARDMNYFNSFDRHDIFDDEILKYRAALEEKFCCQGGLSTNQVDYEQIIETLCQNLMPTIEKETPPQFLAGKMETFLTCRAVANHLMTSKILDEHDGKLLEELSLKALQKTLMSSSINFSDAQLLISELPNILKLNYPAVENIHLICIEIILQLTETLRLSITGIPMFYVWSDIMELENILNLLKTFDDYKHK